ncbi:MAG TPA: N-acetyl-1-D-myo-inositol-2-amino-2-deoxy-alpha-D-glucopyranoside deacetylase [Pseudonocardiaceae bacterium]|nr:N-acetyl-1-D-myo-inositol-2-amino-2-deoxy-alpha-D-glucopyranoside deacetylase [Pseudonocardiaceae bacterium]
MTLTAPSRLLLVHAHPDDESLWTGGTIARYAARGVQVTVVTCTLGEQGEIIPADLALLDASVGDQLGGYRAGELRSACAALGVTDHRYLGGIGRWRDSGMAGDPANAHPRAFTRGPIAEQVAALGEVIADVRPQVVVSYGADGGYGHPDHVRAHDITVAAAAASDDVFRVCYTVRSRKASDAGVAALASLPGLPYRLPAPGELPTVDDDTITSVIDVEEYLPAKLRALRAHATQISVWDDGAGHSAYALSNGIALPVLTHEYFQIPGGDPADTSTDLFANLTGANLTGADR